MVANLSKKYSEGDNYEKSKTSVLNAPRRPHSIYGYDCLDRQLEFDVSPQKYKTLTKYSEANN